MSTSTDAPRTDPADAPEDSSARTGRHDDPSLDARPQGRPENFGLNVRRLRRVRAIVFALLALPILVLGLLAVKFTSMPITQAWHQGAYEDGDYPAAIERLQPVWVANWFEPYLPHLTRGTDLLQQGQNAEAEAELRESLQKWENGTDLNQPLHAQCKIINNLAISIERQAEEIQDPAQRADRLYEAEEIMAPCAGGGGGSGEGEGQGGGGAGNEDSETTEDNGERIREKRREADEEAGNDPDDRGTEQGPGGEEQGGGEPPPAGDPKREDPEGDGPEEEAPTDGSSEEQQKEDELENRNRDAQGGEGEDDPNGGSEEQPKPW
ncbi:hypothetical protein M3C58_11860 [Brachybacterium muris]|uniref:hypothetical protein n=1 Tax=Brachybacterium muris TaxID=219301 RepID=UPI00223C2A73|nr:hypothetical protein [Brachybacterium muris]MCT1998880.1 hypothetical protein [Brachybacterium muris]MCT2261575.1 hypothetical protein [Brachybacterium muris]